jgi:transposase InsO family protein
MSVLQEFEHKFGLNIKNVLTDNGSEFALNFRKYVEKQKITHYHTYPRSPKMNAHCERFNRTIREGVLNINKYKLEDLQEANTLVAEFLDFYNNKRVHFAFKNKMTPLQKRLQYDNINNITAI